MGETGIGKTFLVKQLQNIADGIDSSPLLIV